MLEKKLANFLDGADRSMVAAWKVVDGRLMLERHTGNFPVEAVGRYVRWARSGRWL